MTCSIAGCGRVRLARELCSLHYQRLIRYGDPLAAPSTPEAKFMVRVDIDEGGCWLWVGHIAANGYAIFSDGKSVLAHRWAYERYIGPIPEGFVIDHLCGVRCCVNPLHLEPVTLAENVRRGGLVANAGAVNRAKTHCPRGHAYDGENTYTSKAGKRHCRACARLFDRSAAQRIRNLEAEVASLRAQLGLQPDTASMP